MIFSKWLSLLALPFFLVSSASAASEDCTQISGTYSTEVAENWKVRLDVVQTGCESVTLTATLPTGQQQVHRIGIQGQTALTREDAAAGEQVYEMAMAYPTKIFRTGYTMRNQVLESLWVGSLNINGNGDLVDLRAYYNGQGKFLGGRALIYERQL